MLFREYNSPSILDKLRHFNELNRDWTADTKLEVSTGTLPFVFPELNSLARGVVLRCKQCLVTEDDNKIRLTHSAPHICH